MYPSQNNFYPIVKTSFDYGTVLFVDKCNNCMTIYKEKYNSNGMVKCNYEIFARGCVNYVKKLIYAIEYGKEPDYVFEITSSRNIIIRDVIVKSSLYGKNGMIAELVKAGISFIGNHSDGVRASLIVDYLNSHNLIEEERLPYFNGFSNGEFRCFSNNQNPKNIDAPFYTQKLILGNREISKVTCAKEMYNYYSAFGGKNWLKLTTIIIVSLMFSLFSERGFSFERIVYLCGQGADAAARFLQIYNKNQFEVNSLTDNFSTIKKEIYKSKDCNITFRGEGEKLMLLQDLFCRAYHPKIKMNGQQITLVPKSICVLISDYADELLAAENFCKISIDDVDDNVISEATFGWFILYLTKHIETTIKDGKLDEMLERINDLSGTIVDTRKQRAELTILLCAFEVIKDFFATVNLNVADFLDGELPEEFFADFIFGDAELDERNICVKGREVIREQLLCCRNLIKYEGSQLEVELGDDLVVLYDDNNFYVFGQQFHKFIVKLISENITKTRVLAAFSNFGFFAKEHTQTARLSVRICGNESSRSNWLAFKQTQFIKRFELPLIEKNNGTLSKQLTLGVDSLDRGINIPLCSYATTNNHLGITGDSGMGKSYATLRIIEKLSKMGIPSVILDSADSFSAHALEDAFVSMMGKNLDVISVYDAKLPINLFARQSFEVNGKKYEEKESDVALRVSGLLQRACKLSEKQQVAVYTAILKLFDEKEPQKIKDICKKLDSEETEVANVASSRIRFIADADIFREDGMEFAWSHYLNNGKCSLFSLAGYNNTTLRRMISECLLQDFWRYIKINGNKQCPVAVVIDEIDVLRPKRESTFAELLTLGRKYGVMCIWNTQLLKHKLDEEEISVLNQSATRLYFKCNNLDEKNYIFRSLSKYGNVEDVFSNLSKGKCLAKGTFSSESGVIYEDKLLKVKIPKF